MIKHKKSQFARLEVDRKERKRLKKEMRVAKQMEEEKKGVNSEDDRDRPVCIT